MRIYDNSSSCIVAVMPHVVGHGDVTKSLISYQSSPIDSFLSEELFDASDSDSPPAIHIACDISILFNQQRLGKELSPIVADWFSANQSELSDRYSSLSDDEILSCIKSKYLQRPCEIVDWTKYLSDCLDELVEAKKASESKEPIDPSQGEPIAGNIKS